ncbi:unnamed protein product [Didymodactylos carnosus]|uniref:Ubiquitin conjugation factor E4 core domain-containing protein n=1 Tax=Didymodactylos carnosus TaxID=1234261 RepID=A0A813TRP8_9BILA|nr:unnamed protein product [Didymodactylos carnosus]CAF0815193.1 unnamed protein product [Didymodactylos carnosus]CAF3587730.1 unnamed protein product [Didymodactylos carnosus]CAF3601228.1 unnamed protein product [Didymodactylos carnosus]
MSNYHYVLKRSIDDIPTLMLAITCSRNDIENSYIVVKTVEVIDEKDFIRFLNMAIDDVLYLLNETLQLLKKVHNIESQTDQKGEIEREIMPTWSKISLFITNCKMLKIKDPSKYLFDPKRLFETMIGIYIVLVNHFVEV